MASTTMANSSEATITTTVEFCNWLNVGHVTLWTSSL